MDSLETSKRDIYERISEAKNRLREVRRTFEHIVTERLVAIHALLPLVIDDGSRVLKINVYKPNIGKSELRDDDIRAVVNAKVQVIDAIYCEDKGAEQDALQYNSFSPPFPKEAPLVCIRLLREDSELSFFLGLVNVNKLKGEKVVQLSRDVCATTPEWEEWYKERDKAEAISRKARKEGGKFRNAIKSLLAPLINIVSDDAAAKKLEEIIQKRKGPQPELRETRNEEYLHALEEACTKLENAARMFNDFYEARIAVGDGGVSLAPLKPREGAISTTATGGEVSKDNQAESPETE